MALTPNQLAQQQQAEKDGLAKLEAKRQAAREQSAETKLALLRKLINRSPKEQRVGPRNQGPEPAFRDSRFLCSMIDLRKVEQILGEQP